MEHTVKAITAKVIEFVKEEATVPVDEILVIHEWEHLGIDSLSVVQICIWVEEEYNISVDDSVMECWKGPQNVVDTIKDILNVKE